MMKYSEISQYETMKIQSRYVLSKMYFAVFRTISEKFQGILNYNHCANESSKIPCWTFSNSPVLYFYLYSYLFSYTPGTTKFDCILIVIQ